MTKPIINYNMATAEDLKSVVALHMQTFDHSFTTLLGASFLFQYYRIFLNDHFYFFVAKKENNLVGFIVGVDDYKLLAKYIKKNIYLFFIPILRSVSNVRLIPYVFKRVFSFIFKNRVNSLPLKFTRHNEITSFAVSKNSQCLGIGSNLLKHYLSRVCSKEATGVFITTDAMKNLSTINFYKKNGFFVKHTYHQSKKRKMYLMLKVCT